LDAFLANAEEILETAGIYAGWQGDASDLTFLIAPEGSIRIIAASDWPLESLCRERGATAAYRVSRSAGRVAVEGCSLGRRCFLESESPADTARRLLGRRSSGVRNGHVQAQIRVADSEHIGRHFENRPRLNPRGHAYAQAALLLHEA